MAETDFSRLQQLTQPPEPPGALGQFANTVSDAISTVAGKPSIEQDRSAAQSVKLKQFMVGLNIRLSLTDRLLRNLGKNFRHMTPEVRAAQIGNLTKLTDQIGLTIPGSNTIAKAAVANDKFFINFAEMLAGPKMDTDKLAGVMRQLFENPKDGASLLAAVLKESRATTKGAQPKSSAVLDSTASELFKDTKGVTLFNDPAMTSKMQAQVTQLIQDRKVAVAGATVQQQTISSEAQKALTGFDELLEFVKEMETNFSNEFLGPLKGTGAAFGIRRRLGTYINSPIGQRELTFRLSLDNAVESLARLKSGAAIGVEEFDRLASLLPQATDEPPVFRAGLRRFKKAVTLSRIRRLKRAGQTKQGARQEAARLELRQPPQLPPGAPALPQGFALE